MSSDDGEIIDLVGEEEEEERPPVVKSPEANQDQTFAPNRKRKRIEVEDNERASIQDSSGVSFREQLERDERFQVEDLGGGSWFAICRRFHVPSKETFDETWALHPKEHKVIKMFGKDTPIPRYQQAYGKSYAFSGIVSEAIPTTPVIQELFDRLNALLPASSKTSHPSMEFNSCLCNWYEPHHYIGAHSDDTRQLVPYSPVASISWGATRTFLLTPREKSTSKGLKTREVPLMNGDLVFMGGRCQETHKHEILKLRKGQLGGNRINFSIRCFK